MSYMLYRYTVDSNPAWIIGSRDSILALPSPYEAIRAVRKNCCAAADPRFKEACVILLDALLQAAAFHPQGHAMKQTIRMSLPIMLSSSATAMRAAAAAAGTLSAVDPVGSLTRLVTSWRERTLLDETALQMCFLALAPGASVPPPPSPPMAGMVAPVTAAPALSPPPAALPPAAVAPLLSSSPQPPLAKAPAPLPVAVLLQQKIASLNPGLVVSPAVPSAGNSSSSSSSIGGGGGAPLLPRPLVSEAQDLEAMSVGALVSIVKAQQQQSRSYSQPSSSGPIIAGSAAANVVVSAETSYKPIDSSRLPSVKATNVNSVEPGRLQVRLDAFHRDLAHLQKKVALLADGEIDVERVLGRASTKGSMKKQAAGVGGGGMEVDR
jgi:hypothetical protein